MTYSTDRREQPGVAIITYRSALLKLRCEEAGLPARLLPVQQGPAWPAHRPPAVLDTIDLPVRELITLLVNPPMYRQTGPAHRANNQVPQLKPAPIIAFANTHDWRAVRLLKLSPAVHLICPDDPTKLLQWFPLFDDKHPAKPGAATTPCLVEKPPDLVLDPLLLPILAALPTATSSQAVAEQCGISNSTLARVLRTTKRALGLPSGDQSRFRPEELASTILERLTTAGR